ncbi:MAG: hypothetical protein IPK99_02915 [Flavobacteriales bacterium]|nr:hypothetical protein [Flavobacteriales bacterium]
MFGKVIFGLFGWLVFGLPCVAQSLLHAGTTLEVDLGTTVSVPDDLTLSIAPTAVLVNDGRIAFAPLAVLDEPPGWPVRGLGSEDVHPLLNAAALDLEPAGLGFVLTTSIAPGQLDIERGHTAFTDTSGRISTLRWYRTQTSTNTNLDATIRFTYDPTELNGVPEGIPGTVRAQRCR